MKTKKDWFVGQWQPDEEDPRIVYDIRSDSKGFKVHAFDRMDEEKYVVSKTNWDGKVLRFEIYVPSTQWRTRSCLSLTSRTRLVQELTFWERWKRVSKPAPKNRKDWFVGHWQVCGEDSQVVIEISEITKGFKVRAFDKNTMEEFVVSKTSWNGEELRFETYVPSSECRTRNGLKLVSKNRIVQELTFWEPWNRMRLARG
ncbi:MAG: hypothetical protein JWR26_646 [Pedosphaera sp.]|nr:hypothetical protein [Pedosphaera sp.]